MSLEKFVTEYDESGQEPISFGFKDTQKNKVYDLVQERTNYSDPFSRNPELVNYLKDRETGDLFNWNQKFVGSSWRNKEEINELGDLVASGEALNNPDIQNFRNRANLRGLTDPGIKYLKSTEAQKLFDLKKSNPEQYYEQLATDISDQVVDNWSMNRSEYNSAFNSQLESLKNIYNNVSKELSTKTQTMAERREDLNLPISVVQRIIKEAVI
jgi:hypothetical protein